MDDNKIWERINTSETVEELKQSIVDCFEKGVIVGRSGEAFFVTEMNHYIDEFAEDFPGYATGIIDKFRSLPTRQYGIRQQLCYILLHPTR